MTKQLPPEIQAEYDEQRRIAEEAIARHETMVDFWSSQRFDTQREAWLAAKYDAPKDTDLTWLVGQGLDSTIAPYNLRFLVVGQSYASLAEYRTTQQAF